MREEERARRAGYEPPKTQEEIEAEKKAAEAKAAGAKAAASAAKK